MKIVCYFEPVYLLFAWITHLHVFKYLLSDLYLRNILIHKLIFQKDFSYEANKKLILFITKFLILIYLCLNFRLICYFFLNSLKFQKLEASSCNLKWMPSQNPAVEIFTPCVFHQLLHIFIVQITFILFLHLILLELKIWYNYNFFQYCIFKPNKIISVFIIYFHQFLLHHDLESFLSPINFLFVHVWLGDTDLISYLLFLFHLINPQLLNFDLL